MLEIVCSTDCRPMLEYMAARFSALCFEGEPGERDRVVVRGSDTAVIGEMCLAGRAAVVVPDSSLLLAMWGRAWQEAHPDAQPLVREYSVFAVSPVVIGLRRETAVRLGFPEADLGWARLARAPDDSAPLRTAHASAHTGAGLLGVLAMFQVATGRQDPLTTDAIESAAAREFVQEMEGRVQAYGASDRDLIHWVMGQGEWTADAVIAQEHALVQAEGDLSGGSLAIVYPAEGTFWADYPLALLSSHELPEAELHAYGRFRDYLLSSDAQAALCRFGFRAAGPQLAGHLRSTGALGAKGRYRSQPSVVFDAPHAAVLSLAANAWVAVKRRSRTVLVCDTSASMGGQKLHQAKRSLLRFVKGLTSDDDEVGLVTFSSNAIVALPIVPIGPGRRAIENVIGGLQAAGRTALLDAVELACRELHRRYRRDCIQAAVVLTDGQENESRQSLNALESTLDAIRSSGQPLVVFCVAFGEDADIPTLSAVARASAGDVIRSGPDDLEDVYRRISRFF